MQEGFSMPVLSLFYGIVVRMYKENSKKHKKPHIHAEYSGDEVVVALDGEVKERPAICGRVLHSRFLLRLINRQKLRRC
jgi:hypothetical protein